MDYARPETERIRKKFEGRQSIPAPPAAVFPLLCPVREYDWIPEWDCKLVYTESGLAERDCVFQTERDGDGGIDTWVICRHEPDHLVEFVRINHLRAIRYEIRLSSISEGSTTLVWSQIITALSDEGDQHVARMREEDFVQGIAKMEALLKNYLAGSSTEENSS